MLKFIKGIFSKPAVVQKEEPPIQKDIVAIAEERKNESKSKFDSYLVSVNQKFDGTKVDLENSINGLRNAKLINTKIPEREISIMEGNRSLFVRAAERILSINFPKDNFEEFFVGTEKSFSDYGELSMRPFAILNHFFEHESKEVHINVQSLFKIISEMKENYSPLAQAEMMVRDAKEIEAYSNQMTQFKSNLGLLKSSMEGNGKSQKDLESAKKSFLSSEEYKNHERMVADLENAKNELSIHESSLASVFSPLKLPLQKFARSHQSMAKRSLSYSERPIESLLEDPRKEILEILSQIEIGMNDGTLDIKDKKKTSASSSIKSFDKLFVDGWLNRRDELLSSIAQRSDDLSKSKASEMLSYFDGKNADLLSEMKNIEAQATVLEKKISANQRDQMMDNFSKKYLT